MTVITNMIEIWLAWGMACGKYCSCATEKSHFMHDIWILWNVSSAAD